MSRPANILLFLCYLLLISARADSQVYLDNYLANQLDDYTRNNYEENVIIIPDKDLYFAGGEVKLTIFLTEGKYNFPEALSKAVAIEVMDNTGQPVIRQRFSIDNSRGSGILTLPSSLPTGYYIIRAYTNWMRNDGPETFHHSLISIINPLATSHKLLVNDPGEQKVEIHPGEGATVSKTEVSLITETGSDRISYTVLAGSGRDPAEELILIAHQGGELSFLERIRMDSGSYRGMIAFDRLLPGISEIAILDKAHKFLVRKMVNKPDDASVEYSMRTNKNRYSKRDTVILSYTAEKGSLISISAYLPAGRSDAGLMHHPEQVRMDKDLKYARATRNGYTKILEDKKLLFLPEIRGQIISGSLINGDLASDEGSEIFMARLGWNSDLQIVEIRDDGSFFIFPGAYLQNSNLVFLKNSKEKLSILIHPEFSTEYAQVKMPEFNPKAIDTTRIEKLMISHQIRSVYRSKSEEAKIEEQTKFYGEADQSIVLKDYINLPVMEEFFRELLKLTIFTRESGELKLNILSKYTNRIIGPDPLYLVDGIPVFDTRTILDLDPEHIRSIHIKAHKYIYGNLVCDGVVDIESVRGDASVLDLAEGTATYSYRPPIMVSEKEILDCNFPASDQYFPDMRSVICWQPDISAGIDGMGEIIFSTSDLPGNYIIAVSVLTPDGKFDTFHEEIIVE